jgi:hypothetical protein
MRDREIPIPPTLAQVQGYGADVFCWCNRCHHHVVLAIAVLIARLEPGFPFPAVHGPSRPAEVPPVIDADQELA